jgi:hypothetical protein
MSTSLLRAALHAALFFGVAKAALRSESIRLEARDVELYPEIAFAKDEKPSKAECKAFPGGVDWPSAREWTRFNTSLGGALIEAVPPAASCYPGAHRNPARCDFLLTNASSTHFYIDDPVTALTQWPQGNTCVVARNATGTCTLGGFPSYVVNATTVKHVQAAVNFARNKNIRLIIK